MNERELNTLVDILNNAGIERDRAEKHVTKMVEEAKTKGTSVIRALVDSANSGAHEDTIEFQLSIALKSISIIELHKLSTLASVAI